ncbi:MAG: hypothetical protein ACO3C1_12210 [Ilumatobacteraceae bacterium]
MTALRSTQKRLLTIMGTVTVAALVLFVAMGYAGYKALRGYEGATKVDAQLVELASTTVGMLATVDERNALTTVTVFVLTPESEGRVGGSIVSVPVSCDTTFGLGETRLPLTEVYDTGGADDLALAVESLLSVTLDVSEVANAPAASAILAPIGAVSADLPNDVTTTIDGEIEVLRPRGPAELTVGEVVDVLSAHVDGEPEMNRRSNVESVWSAVADAAGSGVGQVAADGPVDTMAQLFSRLIAGPVASRGLGTSTIDPALNAEGDDVVMIDRVDAVLVFASIAPNSTSAPAPGLVYRIEAPPGYDDRVKYAVSMILFYGQNVQSVYVSPTVPASDATVFEIYDPRFKERTDDASTVFGTVSYDEPTTKIAGVDVVLRLGTGFLSGSISSVPSTTASGT